MKDFMQWLSERGIRTAINGIYPPAYNAVHGMTPNAMAAVTATAPIALKNTAKEKGKCDELSPEMQKEAGCKGKAKEQKNPWENSFKNTQESSFSEGKKSNPVVMRKKEDEPLKIDVGVGRTYNTHLAAFRTGAHKNKKGFNKSDRNKSKSQVKNFEESN